MMANAAYSTGETFPRCLLEQAQRNGEKPAIREKYLGIWQTWTWREVSEEVRALACGLAATGIKRGDKLALIGDNRPRLYWSMSAAQCLGAIPVPMYQDSVADELQFVVEHAEVRFAVAENQEQVDKLLEIKDRCPKLEFIVYCDPRGMRDYSQDFLIDFETLQQSGRDLDATNAAFFTDEIDKGKSSDIACILYTSGTTGNPKGVVLSYESLIKTATNAAEWDKLTSDGDVLAYLPMAWVGDNLFSYSESYIAGFCVNCPESTETVLTDMREIGPSYFFAPPRIFENLLTTVMIRMEDAGALKRRMFHYFMAVAKRIGTRILDGESVSVGDRLLYTLGRLLVYGPLKDTLGFTRIRMAYTAGESISPELFDFYRSLGINLKQLYGQTEASVLVTIQPDGEVRSDSVGVPAPDVEIEISDGGEVLYRSPGVFLEYYKNPEATEEAKTADGWVHTGDAGYFDKEGYLRIIDRAVDVGKLNNGSMYAPKYLENKLKFFPQIKEAVTFGDQQDFVSAFINIDLEAISNWAEKNDVTYASYHELAANDQVSSLIQDCVASVNQELANEDQFKTSQIQRFVVLHKELDPDDGELTRTRKVRRKFVAEKYSTLVDALYSNQDNVHVETEVTFEDGRKGSIEADIKICDMPIAGTPA
ncbi:MAG TPA: AMP-binding protein [Arenicellales bacterium]|jgi:long-chain acyl-CoA synthetase|nr:AMP-binding protein [Arenicellales bacterium]HJP09057.1 AMP-binding protein [Arenicellales bacterium]|tara:strand:- start:2918 stop:4867 length:1950 start_codon:yes stop_codon:yes gene_type:complete